MNGDRKILQGGGMSGGEWQAVGREFWWVAHGIKETAWDVKWSEAQTQLNSEIAVIPNIIGHFLKKLELIVKCKSVQKPWGD